MLKKASYFSELNENLLVILCGVSGKALSESYPILEQLVKDKNGNLILKV